MTPISLVPSLYRLISIIFWVDVMWMFRQVTLGTDLTSPFVKQQSWQTCDIYIYTVYVYMIIYIWRFPKLRVPPVLIHLVRWIFHETIQLWGYPHDGLATPQADGHRPIRAPHQAVEMRTSTCDGKSPFMSKRLKGDRSGWSHYDLIMIFFIIIWMIHNHWYDWYEIRNDKNVSYVS